MIKIICLIMFMSSSCITQPLPEIPEIPENTDPTHKPTAPTPPVVTKSCLDNSFVSKDSRDKLVIPPAQYALNKTFFINKPNKNVLYINYTGRIVKKGFEIGESFIVCKKKGAKMGGAGLSKERQDLINYYVEGYYADIGIQLEVVNYKPDYPHLEMIVGGRYKDLGCGANRGILGVAPFDKGNQWVEEVGFAFVSDRLDDYTIASTIAHEAGHTYGLDHINNKCGVMYYAITDYIVGFREGKIRGTFSKRQDSKKVLKHNLD